MKKSVAYLFSTLVLVIVFIQCKKDDTVYKGYFYTGNSTAEVKLSLYLDGVYMGELPYVNTKQNGFTSDSIKKYSLPIPVKAGKHELESKDQNGTIRSQGKFKITKTKVSSSGGVGGQEVVLENDELRIGVSF